MGRFGLLVSAVIMSFSVVASTVATAQAAPAAAGKVYQVLTLPQRADILNKMAIYNARKGDAKKAAHFFLRSFHISRKARDKKRAIRAIANLKRLEKKFGRAAILKQKKARGKTEKPLKPYHMPEWRKSHEA